MKALNSKLLKQEQYKVVCISTGDIHESDMDVLAGISVNSDMVANRESGFFVKIYDDAESNDLEYGELSGVARDIIEAARELGFTMIEISCDVLCMGDEPLWM